jgi:hypothetical protein
MAFCARLAMKQLEPQVRQRTFTNTRATNMMLPVTTIDMVGLQGHDAMAFSEKIITDSTWHFSRMHAYGSMGTVGDDLGKLIKHHPGKLR